MRGALQWRGLDLQCAIPSSICVQRTVRSHAVTVQIYQQLGVSRFLILYCRLLSAKTNGTGAILSFFHLQSAVIRSKSTKHTTVLY